VLSPLFSFYKLHYTTYLPKRKGIYCLVTGLPRRSLRPGATGSGSLLAMGVLPLNVCYLKLFRSQEEVPFEVVTTFLWS